jgi:serine/threonine protein phosphatase PrpC
MSSSSTGTLPVMAEYTFLNSGSRSIQEDFVLSNREKGIFVVADGFGGAQPGALASKTASEEVQRFLFKEAGDLDATLPFVLRSYFSLAGNVLFNALIHANRKVMALNKGKNVHEKGGTSVIAGFLDGDLLAIANVGVCSASVIREGRAQELVTPRSYGRLVDPFSKKEEGPQIDAPLMALGVSEDLEPEIFEYRVRPGDWLVLHTDGLTQEFMLELANLNRGSIPGVGVDALGADFGTEIQKTFEQSVSKDNAAATLICF